MFIILLLLGCQQMPQEQHDMSGDSVAAMVNRQPITQEQVQEFQERIRAQSGQLINETVALDNLIANRLLVQDAKKQGIALSEEDVERMLTEELESRGTTLDAFRSELSPDQYTDMIKQTMERLSIMELGMSLVNVTNETVQEFYEKNKQQLGNATMQEIRQYLEQQAAQQALSQYAHILMQQAEIER